MDFLIRGGGDGDLSLESSECSSDSSMTCFPLLAGILYLLAKGAGDGDAEERFDPAIWLQKQRGFWNFEERERDIQRVKMEWMKQRERERGD